MNDFNRDVIVGALCLAGMWSFVSGEFVAAPLLFSGATIFSYLFPRRKQSSDPSLLRNMHGYDVKG